MYACVCVTKWRLPPNGHTHTYIVSVHIVCVCVCVCVCHNHVRRRRVYTRTHTFPLGIGLEFVDNLGGVSHHVASSVVCMSCQLVCIVSQYVAVSIV